MSDITSVIINKMIEEDLPVWDPPSEFEGTYKETPYQEKDQFDLRSFKYFHKLYLSKQEENPKYKDITFTNFLKIARPEEGFDKELKDAKNVDESYDAIMWKDV